MTLCLSLLIAALLVVGCIGEGPSSPAGSVTPTAAPWTVSPSVSPSTPATSSSSAAPTPTEVAASSLPSPTPSEVAPSSSAGAGSVASCTGTQDNRDFYASVAAAVDWPVYCPSMTGRWSVITGSYRLAGGGHMDISYKGPNDARIELHEGAFCSDANGCVPPGTESGDVTFGDLPATLVQLDDGRVAVVVARGERESWLAIGSGLDATTFASITAGLIRLD
jgi:hypothetical protein